MNNRVSIALAMFVALSGAFIPAHAKDLEGQESKSAEESWSRVRRIKPGREITVTIHGSVAAKRNFVSADDSSLTVMNPMDDRVELHARPDIAEIAIRRKGRGVWGHLGLLGGYFVGALSGGYIAGVACRAGGGKSCDGAFMRGMLVGGVAGGAYGFHAAKRESEDVIYRSDHLQIQ